MQAMSELADQSSTIMARMDTVMGVMSKARKKEAELKIKWERMQEELGQLLRAKNLHYMQKPELSQAVNPVTNMKDQGYTTDLIRFSVEGDEDYIRLMEKFYELQGDYYMANVEHTELAEELGVLKAKSRLMYALLVYASEEGGTE